MGDTPARIRELNCDNATHRDNQGDKKQNRSISVLLASASREIQLQNQWLR